MELRKRNRFERIILAPKHFRKQLAIGRDHIPLKNRIVSAFMLTKLLLRD